MAKRMCDVSFNARNDDVNFSSDSTNRSKYARRAVLKSVAHDVDKQLNDVYSKATFSLNQSNTTVNAAALNLSNTAVNVASTSSIDVRHSPLHSSIFQEFSSSDEIFPYSDDVSSICSFGSGSDSDDGPFYSNVDDCNDTFQSSLNKFLDGCKELSLKDQLLSWALECSVPLSHLTKLLKILHPYHKELPKDARTLLHTPRQVNVQSDIIENGKFNYFGVASNLKSRIPNLLPNTSKHLHLTFNIDGIPLFRSSNSQFWPILGSIDEEANHMQPFVVGIFFGASKPSSVSAFMQDFTKEMECLLQNGFVCGTERYQISIRAFICDAPARSFLKCIKGHSGYYSCEKCEVKGNYIDGKVVFPIVDKFPERTDQSFRVQSQKDHHLGVSPLCSLPIDLIKCFPLDTMHLLWLGIVRRLLVTWVKGKPSKSKLSSKQVQIVSRRMESYSEYLPSEFGRRPRGLQHLDRWKASEFRQFLLYIGVTALQGILKHEYYQHFLTLHVALTILQSETHRSKFHTYAESLLVNFVHNVKGLYGDHMMVYNVHGLLHLAKDVEDHRDINHITAFPFEDFLGKLKRLVRSPNLPMEQVCNRIAELNSHNVDISSQSVSYFGILEQPHEDGPLPTNIHEKIMQYKKVKVPTKKVTISTQLKDKCIKLLDGRYMLVENILKITSSNEIILYCSELKKKTNLFCNPCPSLPYLGTSEVSNASNQLIIIKLNEISQKCVHLKISGNNYAVLPMVHSI